MMIVTMMIMELAMMTHQNDDSYEDDTHANDDMVGNDGACMCTCMHA